MSESSVPPKYVRNRTNYEIGKCEEGILSTIGTKSVQSTVHLGTDVTSGCTTTQITTVSDVNVLSSEGRLSAGKGKGGKAKKPKKPKKPKPKKTKKTKGKGKKGTKSKDKSKSKERKKGKSKGKTKKKKGKGNKSKDKKQKKGKKSKNKKDKKKKQKEKKKKDQKSGESGGDEEGGGESTEQTTKGKEIKGKKEKSGEKTSSSSSSSTSTSSSSVSWKQKVKMAAHQQAEKIRALGDEKVEEMKRRREAENERVRELLERHRPLESIGPDPIPFCSGRFDAIFLLPSKMTTVPTMGTDPDVSEKSESIEDSLED